MIRTLKFKNRILVKSQSLIKRYPDLSSLFWIIFGAFLRVHQYLYNRSLWSDEAMLAVNIVDRSFSDLFGSLEYQQQAPIGFLVLTKIIVQLLGPTEYALRLPSLLFGILSLILFYQVGKRYLSPWTVPIALAFFALSDPQIYYSQELKPYSSDVFFCLLTYLAASQLLTLKKISPKYAIGLAFSAALMVWFSFPSIFFLVGATLSLACYHLYKRNKSILIWLFIISLCWSFSFLIYYRFILMNPSNSEIINSLSASKENLMAPIPFLDPAREIVQWYATTFINIFKSPVGFQSPGLAGILFLSGCVGMGLYKARKYRLLILLSPLFVTLGASLTQKYPFSTITDQWIYGGRFILFLAPAMILLIAEGIDYFRPRINKFVLTTALAILIASPFTFSIHHLKEPRTYEEVSSTLKYIVQHEHNPNQSVIYVHPKVHRVFRYYQDALGIMPEDYVVGVDVQECLKSPKCLNKNLSVSSPEYVKAIQGDLEQLQGNPAVWFLFSRYVKEDEQEFFLNQLNKLGTKIDLVEKTGSSAYLYDLSRAAHKKLIEGNNV